MVAFRWFSRYSGLNVSIDEQIEPTVKSGRRYIERMDVKVSWT